MLESAAARNSEIHFLDGLKKGNGRAFNDSIDQRGALKVYRPVLIRAPRQHRLMECDAVR